MKCVYATFSFLLLFNLSVQSQNVGLSFAYLFPTDGTFAAPISPFSIRGIGISLNNYIALQTGLSLYRISGLGLKSIPLNDKSSLVGPNFTTLIPGEIVFKFMAKTVQINIKGGGFFFYAFDQHLNYGNLDRAIRNYYNFDIANSSFKFKNRPGFGWTVGLEFNLDINKKFEISIETNYLRGQSKIPLSGGCYGFVAGGDLTYVPIQYNDAKVNFSGIELSLGVAMKAHK